MAKITIIYDPTSGQAMNDAATIDFGMMVLGTAAALTTSDVEFTVGNWHAVDSVRALVAEQQIPYGIVQVAYADNCIPVQSINKDGSLNQWPKSRPYDMEQFLHRIIYAGSAHAKAKRGE